MRVKDSIGWVEVDKHQVIAPEVVQTVVGLAHAGMSPGVSPATGLRVFDKSLFVQPGAVDRGEFMQLCTPLAGLVDSVNACEFEC